MVARSVEGVVIASFRTAPAEFRSARQAGVPVVMLGGTFDSDVADQVMSDDRAGTRAATDYLLDQGMSRIGFIDGESGIGPGEHRVAGYREALRSRAVAADPELVVTTSYSRQGGIDGLGLLLALPVPPRAVLCANDLIAIGALSVANERGVRVPDDLAIVGFDDIDAAALVTPPLTTVLNPGYELGQVCGRLLLDRMSGDSSDTTGGRQVVVPSRFIVRSSA
jgi:DNA-binding LacI/PurR family transcriptional regulator